MLNALSELLGAFIRYLLFNFFGPLNGKEKRNFDSFLKEKSSDTSGNVSTDHWNGIIGLISFVLMLFLLYLIIGQSIFY